MLAVLGIGCCLGIGAAVLSSCAKSREAAPSPEPSGSSADGAKPDERVIQLSVLSAFGSIERPPAKYHHDRHTAALEQEGCEICHPKDASGEISFTFPKTASGKGTKALMNSFHDECAGCHRKWAAAGKKSGPVTCGECHRRPFR